MKRPSLPATFAIFLAVTSTVVPARAETDLEREYKQLKDQREKALAVAEEPINRRYKEMLTQLLRRATQSNELETAIKIKRELEDVAGAPAMLRDSKWTTHSGVGGSITLRADGTAISSWGTTGSWKYKADDKLTLQFEKSETWQVDPAFKFIISPTGTKWNRES